MNAAHLSSLWSAVGDAMAQHLWQSTLVACIAGVLTLALRKNHARARYWLWMAASVKFLVPFSWLVALGNSFAWTRQSGAATDAFYQVIQEVGQPLMQPSVLLNRGVGASMASERLMTLLPAILAGVWLCGFAAVLFSWSVRWRRISANIRDAALMREGREVETLRRLEQLAAMPQRIEMRRSGATLEPGIFGWARPILLWPEGISDRLDDAHVEAIIAHELWHVRRKDNLAATLHMVVEAIFWFHPLVWWVGARLIDERERACDEEVLAFGSERQVYAESILKVCEFCVASPLACVSGVTGADLKKRMVHIMSQHVVHKLDFSRRLLLSAAALVAIVAPIAFGLFNATPSRAQSQESSANAAVSFQSVTIKPGEIPTLAGGPQVVHDVRMMVGPAGFRADNVSLRALIQEAYGVQADQIDGPSDLLDTTYNIDANSGHAASSTEDFEQAVKENHLMLQKLLAERFKLVLHHESKTLPNYALVVGENGAKLQPSQSNGQTMDLMGPRDKKMKVHRKVAFVDGDQMMGLIAQGISTSDLSAQLSRQLGNTVIDRTGLTGSYDVNLQWAADAKNGAAASGTSIFKAVQEQLGLKLEPQESPMDFLVIDHIEKPAEN
jgi:bla regulator protein BlaR1